MNYGIIGGDLRIVNLAKMLTNDNNIVYVYGLESKLKLEDFENKKMFLCNNLSEIAENSDFIISSIPFSKDNENINAPFSTKQINIENALENLKSKTIIAGSISKNILELADKYNVKIIDIMKNEKLAILNAISTAEGTIQVIMENTDKIMHGSNALILGFGRLGKVIANKLKMLSVNVTCAARKESDFAWMQAYGYKKLDINNLDKNLYNFDIIINTVPSLILDKDKLDYINKNSLIVDLASKPGGVDFEYAKQKGIKTILALGLPGKVAPFTSAEFIKSVIYDTQTLMTDKSR